VITVKAPAKVNLQLAVGPKRPDGYHRLVTVFHAIDLVDEVTVEPSDGGIELAMSGEGSEHLPTDTSNLAVRAAQVLADHAGVPADVRITIRKSIPIAAGLAGGSADAAATLVACAALWQTRTDDLPELAAQLGSDVPFALAGGTAMGTGRGEHLVPVLTRTTLHWVLAISEQGLSTPEVYAECDRMRGVVGEPHLDEDLIRALRVGDIEQVGKRLSNDLQPAALALRPQLQQLLATGDDLGALGSIVSGSGPTCAFLVRDDAQAIDLAVALMSTGLCRTVKRATGPSSGAETTYFST